MHNANEFLRTLALVLGVAAATTVLFQRLRQPVIFGYVLAGLIIGPHVPIPLVANAETVFTLSELGVILLMFSLGLEFSFRRLAAGGFGVIMIAVLETSVMLWLGYVAGRLLGWSILESLFAGSAIAISSTTVIVKSFAQARLRERFTEIVFAVLILEDLIAILLLAVLTPAAAGAALSPAMLGTTLLRLVGFLVALLALGMLVVPRLIRFIVRLQRPETTLVASIGICFALAQLAHSIGYSVALGAFLAGSLVAESGEAERVGRLVEPVRDMFVAVFFVSVGMQIDPAIVASHWPTVLLFTGLVIAGKIGAVSLSAFLSGAGTRTALQAGMSLAQVGEFSIIISGVGLAGGVVSPTLYPIVAAVAALTAFTTPLLIRAAGPVASAIDRRLPRALQTFVALYGSWIESWRERTGASADRAVIQRAIRSLALDAVVIVALCIGASNFSAALGSWLALALPIPAAFGPALIVIAAVLLAAPFLLGILRTGRSLGQSVARRAFPDPQPDRLDLAAAPRRALVVTLQLATVLIVGMPLVALTQPFLPPFAGLALFGAALIVLSFVVWKGAANLHGHVRAAAEAIVDAIGKQSRPGAGDDAERALHRAYQLLPGIGEPFPVRLVASHPAVGRTLAELSLRGRTGATIVAISRGSSVVLVPDGHDRLAAGDVVALAGTHAAIDAAREVLLGSAPEPTEAEEPSS